MSGKALIIATCAAALAAAGCTAPREPAVVKPKTPAAAVPATAVPKTASRPEPIAKPAPPPPSRPKVAKAASRSELPALVGANSSWNDSGTILLVTRTNPAATAPVPIFRQAIVLANVRAALAGSRAAPKAEFRRGLLTLTFTRGTPAEVAEAINRALSVPEVQRLAAAVPAI